MAGRKSQAFQMNEGLGAKRNLEKEAKRNSEKEAKRNLEKEAKRNLEKEATRNLEKEAKRNLEKASLGGVIFGCTKITMKECLSKQLFGLPGSHFSYVKNIHPGLPLFLFNYLDRKLYGIFEAVSDGNLNIDPYAMTLNDSERTQFSAQVQVRMRQQCQPLTEDQFKPIILDNYYTPNKFWFELDHGQTARLMSKLSRTVVAPGPSAYRGNARGNRRDSKREVIRASGPPVVMRDLANSKECGTQQLQEPSLDPQEAYRETNDIIYLQLKELAEKNLDYSEAPKGSCVEETSTVNVVTEISGNNSDSNSGNSLCNHGAIIVQLLEGIRELYAFREEQIQKSDQVEQKMLRAENEIKQLKSKVMMLESKSDGSMVNESKTLEGNGSLVIENGTLETNGSKVIENGVEPEVQDDHDLHLDFGESIFLVGGTDGSSWLSSLDLYSPSQDALKSLKPMSCVRSHTAAVDLLGELYVFGGGNGFEGYDTVESYNLARNIWSPRPALNMKKHSLAGAALDKKIFAMGGHDGNESLSFVEMYDINVGRWIIARSMLQKRSALATVELNGALYAVGGYDGHYLQSAERFDPRERSWCKIDAMSTPRGGHSLVVMNEKLYALGGYDGMEMTSSIEIYDPRLGRWLTGEPMNQSRGNAAAAVLNDSIYVIGGALTNIDMTTMIEQYVEGQGWELMTYFKGPGRRCFSSAIVVACDDTKNHLAMQP